MRFIESFQGHLRTNNTNGEAPLAQRKERAADATAVHQRERARRTLGGEGAPKG